MHSYSFAGWAGEAAARSTISGWKGIALHSFAKESQSHPLSVQKEEEKHLQFHCSSARCSGNAIETSGASRDDGKSLSQRPETLAFIQLHNHHDDHIAAQHAGQYLAAPGI